MADSKITDLTEKTVPAGTEEFVINDGGLDRKIKMSNISGMGPMVAKAITGRYYGPFLSYTTTPAAGSLNTVHFALTYLPGDTAVDQIACYVSTLGAGAVVRLGAYTVGSDGMPGSLLFDAGTVSAATTGIKTIAISQTLPSQFYLCGVLQTAAASLYHDSGSNSNGHQCIHGGSSAIDNQPKFWSQTSVTGALPATAAASSSMINSGVMVRVRVA